MRPAGGKAFLLLSLACLALVLPARRPLWGEPGPAGPHFLCYGRLFAVEAGPPGLRQSGAFHPTAPAAAESPDGLFWGRISARAIAGIDPATGAEVARIALPDVPYELLITRGYRAYIAHTTLTRDGFSLSVVDLRRRAFVRRISGIRGLVTDMDQWGPYVYLTALGVGQPAMLYVYRIDTRDDSLTEVVEAPRVLHHWQLAIGAGNAYLCHISAGTREAPRIDLFDLEEGRISGTLPAERLGGVAGILEAMTFFGGDGYFPCLTADGRFAIGVFSTGTGALERILPTAGKVTNLLGLQGDRLLYRDNLATAGTEGMKLYFYDLGKGREVAAIDILRWIGSTSKR